MHTSSALPSSARQSTTVRPPWFLLTRRQTTLPASGRSPPSLTPNPPRPPTQAALRGLRTLYWVEGLAGAAMYLLSSVLVLYLGDAAGLHSDAALRTVATINALCCLGPLLGGWLADRYISLSRSVVAGSITITMSLLLFAIPQPPLLTAMALLILGCTLFRSNVIALAGQLARTANLPVESAYRRVYVAYNAGATISPLLVGPLCARVGWSGLFLAAALTMGTTVLLLCLHFEELQRAASTRCGSQSMATAQQAAIDVTATPPPLWTILGLLVALALWAACIGQSDGLLLLWARDHTRLQLWGLRIVPSMYMALPALLVMLCAPLSGVLERFAVLRPKPRRLLLGIGTTTIAMLVLTFAALPQPTERGSPLALLICYALIGAAEVLVVPIVQNLLSQHWPAQRAGVAIASSYAALAAGFYLAGAIGSLSNHIPAAQVFALLAGLTLASGALMAGTMRAKPHQAIR